MDIWQDKWNKARRIITQRRQARRLIADARASGRTGPVCLISNLAQMGDMVMSAGIVAGLRAKFPDAVLLFACPAQWQPVLEGDPCLDGLLGVQSWLEVRALARSGVFETVYVLDIPMPTLLRYLDNIPQVFRYTEPTTENWFQHNRPLLSFYEANAGLPEGSTQPRLWVPQADHNFARTLWAKHGLENTDVISLHTHSSMPAKNWPPQQFAALIARWHEKYQVRFVLVGGPGEGDALAALPGVVSFAGQLSIKQTAAVIARSRFFVGPDSGLAYVAEAVGIPGLILLGATVQDTSGPRSSAFSYLRAPGACEPACHRACDRQPLCITHLSVDMVDAALYAAWQEARCVSR